MGMGALCALLAFCTAATAHAQAAAKTGALTQAQIVQRLERQAQAYQAAIAKMPIDVRQTVRRYNASGHLKKARQSSFPYAFPAGAAGAQGNQSSAVVDLSDGVTLPLVFLPGSVAHLSIRAETPDSGPWIVHFKNNPCPSHDVRGHLLGANVIGQCLEGDAYIDPATGEMTRIRMNMGGLPIIYRSLGFPRGVEVIQLSNDVTFQLLKTPSGAAMLVPAKSQYVTYTSHERIVTDQTFDVTPPGTQAPASR